MFLVSAEPPAIRRLEQATDPRAKYSWAYLGKSVIRARNIQKHLGSRFTRLPIGDLLQEAARSARKDYIEYTGSLSSSTGSPIWFLSSVSERNPFITTLLLYYSYIEAGRRLAGGSGGGDLVIIGESDAVLDTLAEVLAGSGNSRPREMIRLSAGGRTTHLGKILTKVIRKSWFIARFSFRILCARLLRARKGRFHSRSSQAGKHVVLHSWTDARSFRDGEGFTNPYFGETGQGLERRYPSFLYLSDVLPTYWYPRAVLRLLKDRRNVHTLEEFLSVQDLFSAVSTSVRHYPQPSDIPLFRDVDVSRIVMDEIEGDRSDTRLEQAWVYSRAAGRLCREFDVGLFLYGFEHHTWEKMVCRAIREARPGAIVAGYAIAFINPMYTCFSLSAYEQRGEPLPDIIFTSGEQGRSMLTRSGFREDMIRVGGAIRYPEFLTGKTRRKSPRGNSIMLVLTGELNSSLELVYKALDAFSSLPGVRIVIKCHPTVPFSLLHRSLPSLPDSFSVTDTPIGELLEDSDLVLYTESTVCVEAVAAGVPVFHVSSDHFLDINIFDGNPAVPSSADPEEIRERSEEILEGKYILPSPDTLKELFMPVDTDTLVSSLLALLAGK
ncbi:MAG: hypothetical protein ACM3X8_06340 [Methanomicrobiales archaeon]